MFNLKNTPNASACSGTSNGTSNDERNILSLTEKLKPGRKPKVMLDDEQFLNVADMKERKRLQNREAQRAFRERRTGRIQELEGTVNDLKYEIATWENRFNELKFNYKASQKEIQSLKLQIPSNEAHFTEKVEDGGEDFKDRLLNDVIDNFKPMVAVGLKNHLAFDPATSELSRAPISMSSMDGRSLVSTPSNTEVSFPPHLPAEPLPILENETCVFSDKKGFACVCKSLKVPTGFPKQILNSKDSAKQNKYDIIISPESSVGGNYEIDFNEIELKRSTSQSCCRKKRELAEKEVPKKWSCQKNCTNLFDADTENEDSLIVKPNSKKHKLNVEESLYSKVMSPSRTDSFNTEMPPSNSSRAVDNVLRDMDRHALS